MSKTRRPGTAVVLIGFLFLLTNVALAATPVKVLGDAPERDRPHG